MLPGKFGITVSHWATLFPYILWNLWNRRNDTVFQVHSVYRDSVYDHSLRMVEMGLRDNGRLRLSGVELSTENRNVVWCKPPHGWCKLNFDGAVCRNSKMASCGGVLRDVDGRWLMGYSKRLGVCSILDSKLWGLLEGLLSVWSLRIHYLVVETDSMDAYCILTESSIACGGSTLVPYILELLSRPWEVRMSHVKKGGNALADCMAKVAPVSDFIVHRYLDPSLDCIHIIEEEAAGGAAMVLPF
ncbi:hypothetical protein GQ457_02G014870 [Hibiscus cannabinus]